MTSPTNTTTPEWQNENSLRAYPLADDAPATAVIPEWLLSDLRVTCSDEYDLVYVSGVYVSHALLSVAVSGRRGGQTVGLLARTVTRDELEPDRAYSMDRISDTASGAVSFGEPPSDAMMVKLAFTPEEAPLAESAVTRVRTPGVTKVVDPFHGTEATGIIDLSGNSEFRTSVDPDDPQTIVVTLSDLYRDLTTSVCDAVPGFDTCGRTPVRSINGVAPTDDGTITIDFR